MPTLPTHKYDEKAAYERRRTHLGHASWDSKASNESATSTLFLSEKCQKWDRSDAPPPYAHVFYNTLNDKPLPPLPRVRRVLFAAEKPLPPLPRNEEEDGGEERLDRRDGENAWWAKGMS